MRWIPAIVLGVAAPGAIPLLLWAAIQHNGGMLWQIIQAEYSIFGYIAVLYLAVIWAAGWWSKDT